MFRLEQFDTSRPPYHGLAFNAIIKPAQTEERKSGAQAGSQSRAPRRGANFVEPKDSSAAGRKKSTVII
jgi:hypothetical protein